MKPRVLIIGKSGSIVHWLEDTRDGFEDAGAAARVFSLNGNRPLMAMRLRFAKLRGTAAAEQFLVRQLETALAAYHPQLVLFVQAYWASALLMDVVRARGIPSAGWVGDRFGLPAADLATRLDRVYYTDSGFLAEAESLGFPANGRFLPHAANDRQFFPAATQRTDRIVFVAVPTRHRLDLLRQVAGPISLYGRRWSALGPSPHEVHDYWVARKRLARIYQESLGVLNVRNELNVFNGLNQRSFEPAACGTGVIHDAVADIERCFEPGKEILVYRNAQELDAICGHVRKDRRLARRIGAAGLVRAQAHHTCAHRAKTILHDFGLGI